LSTSGDMPLLAKVGQSSEESLLLVGASSSSSSWSSRVYSSAFSISL
jgi:hypothetical protein